MGISQELLLMVLYLTFQITYTVTRQGQRDHLRWEGWLPAVTRSDTGREGPKGVQLARRRVERLWVVWVGDGLATRIETTRVMEGLRNGDKFTRL